MKHPPHMQDIFTLIIPFIILTAASGFAAEPPKTPPDLTLDRSVDRKLTYNLGPTGLRGWIYTRPANFADSQQGKTTTASRESLESAGGRAVTACMGRWCRRGRTQRR